MIEFFHFADDKDESETVEKWYADKESWFML